MVLTIYIIINLTLGTVFLFFVKKKLHVLEIFAYWCFVGIIIQNVSAISFLHFNFISFPEMKSYIWADTINRVMLTPLIVLSFLNLFIKVRGVFLKATTLILFSFILFGVDQVSYQVGLYKYNYGSIWWTYLIDLSVLILSIMFLMIFRYIFYKEGSVREFYV